MSTTFYAHSRPHLREIFGQVHWEAVHGTSVPVELTQEGEIIKIAGSVQKVGTLLLESIPVNSLSMADLDALITHGRLLQTACTKAEVIWSRKE